MLIITEAKKVHFFVCKLIGSLSNMFRDFVKMTLTRVSNHCLWLESHHSVQIRDSSRVSNSTLHDSSHGIWLLDSSYVEKRWWVESFGKKRFSTYRWETSSHWLQSRYHWYL